MSRIEEWLGGLPDWECGIVGLGEMSPRPVEVSLRALGLLPYPCGVIQVVGSKGKGSVAQMLGAMAQAHGLRVGVYTSPHLLARAERVQIDGAPRSPSRWEQAGEVLSALLSAPKAPALSRFEAETVMALWCFAKEACDLVILEAGMGGCQDATSALSAEVVALTSVELEHTAVLGSQLAQITKEKIGMLKAGVPLVVGPLPTVAMRVARQLTRSRGCALLEIGLEVAICRVEHTSRGSQVWLQLGTRTARQEYDFFLSVLGPHQPYMAAVAVAALRAWLAQSGQSWSPTSLQALSSLSLPGRLQHLRVGPSQGIPHTASLLLDVAHTPRSVEAALEAAVLHLGRPPDAVLLALNRDKPFEEILERLLQRCRTIILTTNPGPRGADANQLMEGLPSGIPAELYALPELEDARHALLKALPTDGVGLALGSFQLIGALLSHPSLP